MTDGLKRDNRAPYDPLDYVSRGPLTDPKCRDEVSEVFIWRMRDRGVSSEFFFDGMRSRMAVSCYKYGHVVDAYPHKVDALGSIPARLDRYWKGDPARGIKPGNAEWLMDAANFCMIEFMRPRHPEGTHDLVGMAVGFMQEFMFPTHPEAHFAGTDADQSPGRIEACSGDLVQFSNRDIFA